MPANKLGRFMRGPEFLQWVSLAIEDAARDLESRGIELTNIECEALAAPPADADEPGRCGEHP